MTEKRIGLVEHFWAVQGEGFNAGRTAIFVRLAGCPLACEFATDVVCDTPYQQVQMKVTLDELFETIIPCFGPAPHLDQRPMLIFTGGEPVVHPMFDTIMQRAHDINRYFYIAVETSGIEWKAGIEYADWISVSPKVGIPQTSKGLKHNLRPVEVPQLHPAVRETMAGRPGQFQYGTLIGGEYRYVITGSSPTPPFHPATAHFVSPAVYSDGSGEEWKRGFPGFAPEAVERCLEIVKEDPRWRISIQTHKILGVR